MDSEDGSRISAINDESDSEKSSLLQLHQSIKTSSFQCNSNLQKVITTTIPKNEGLSLLSVKIDSMCSYLSNLSYLMLLKSCGKSIQNEQIREKLVEERVIMERVKPIEQKLKYHIEKLVKAAITGKSDPSDKSNFRANVDDLMESSDDDEAANDEPSTVSAETKEKKKAGIYVPPKVAAVSYDGDTKEEKERKLLERAKKRALNSSIMQELKEEYLETPVEISYTNTLRNTQTKFEKERENYEETYFTRIPTTKKDKHREKLISSLTMTNLGQEVTRFEDISALEGVLPKTAKKRKSTGKKSLRLKKSKIEHPQTPNGPEDIPYSSESIMYKNRK